MTLDELKALREAPDEDKLLIARMNRFAGAINEIDAWLDAEIERLEDDENVDD